MADEIAPQKFLIDTPEKLAAWTGDIAAWNAWCATHEGTEFVPLDLDRPVHPILRGEAAMELWRKGKKAWNAWVAANPCADVDFSNQTFEANAENLDGKPLIGFEIFVFPEGNVSFFRSTFNNGDVSFDDALFGVGDVDFAATTFGKGDISFDEAAFGEGNVNFDEATFSEGNVTFEGAQFGKGELSFDYAKFGNGNVNFEGAQFGEGDISFDGAVFGRGEVSFAGADFGNGNVSFDDVAFGEGNVSFNDVRLGIGGVEFFDASFGPGFVSMRNLVFQGIARFDGLKELEYCTQFSFEGCSFDKLFTFSHEGRMGCPLDLRRTKLTHGIVLHDVQCDYKVPPPPGWKRTRAFLVRHTRSRLSKKHRLAWGLRIYGLFRKIPVRAVDREDSQRFRRLKELATSENNRAKALEFNKQELRSQRGHDSHPLQDFLQFFYWLCSDYGTSVMRPALGLVGVTALFTVFYAGLASNPALSAIKAWQAAITYSGGNMFAFIPIGRSALEQSRTDLFCDPAPYEILWVAGAQSVLSVILLFLLGLGLRNMFRL